MKTFAIPEVASIETRDEVGGSVSLAESAAIFKKQFSWEGMGVSRDCNSWDGNGEISERLRGRFFGEFIVALGKWTRFWDDAEKRRVGRVGRFLVRSV